MNIDFTKNDDNSAQINLKIEPKDYIESFESELKKYRKKVSLKGFRKGKTPKSMIRKIYGASVLTDIVTKKLQDSLFEYLDEEKIDILGQPIPSESQEPIDFKAVQLMSYSFKFDLGLKPEFEIGGLVDPYHCFDATISDEEIDKQLDTLRRRGGNREQVEKDFEDDDLITFNATELEDGEVKKGGLETTFEVMVNMMEEEFKEKVLKLAIGDGLDFDIHMVEKDMTEDSVRKYLMKLDDEDMDQEVHHEFRGEIVDATRLVLADLDEEFLTTAFGEDVKTEEEARAFLKEDIKGYLDEQANSILFQEVHDKVMSDTEIDLPDEFLKKWLFQSNNNNEKEEQPVTFEEIEARYENQFRESLKWQLISDKLSKKYDVKVEEQEIIDELGRRIQQYMPGQQLNEQVYGQILHSLAQDKKQVQNAHDQILNSKIFMALREDLILDKEEISQDDFEQKLKEIAETKQKEQEANRVETDHPDEFEEE